MNHHHHVEFCSQGASVDSPAVVIEFLAVPIVSMEKGKSVLVLVGISGPLAFVLKPSNYRVDATGF